MKKLILLVLFIAYASSFQLFAFESDSTQVLNLSLKGEEFMSKNKLDSAILFLDSANSIINKKKLNNIKLVHGVKNRLGICLAYKQFNRNSIKIFQELKSFYLLQNQNNEYDIQIAQLYNNIAINYNLLFDYEQSIRYFDSSLVVFQRNNAQFENQIRNLYLNKALNHLDLSNYQSAIENLELSKIIRLKNPESDLLEYEKMKENLVYSEVLIELNQNPNDILEARIYLKENVEFLEKLFPKDQYLGYSKSLLSKTYSLLNDYDSALLYANETILFFKSQYGPDYTGLITKTTDLGRVYSLMGKDGKALQILDSAIAIPTSDEVDKNFYKADAHLWKAKIHLKNKKINYLEEELLKATKLVFPTFSKSDDIFANPDTDSLYHSPVFSIFFIKKGNLLKGIYSQNGNIEYLKASLEAYTRGINIGMRTRKGLAGLRAKSLFASMLSNNFDEAITVAYEIYQNSGKIDDFWKIIWLSDLSKAASLKDKVNGKEKISFGLPEYILAKEIDLKSNLLYFEQAVYKDSFTKNVRSQDLESENMMSLVKSKEEMESFKKQLKKDYPNYYSLEYGSSEIAGINLLQSKFEKEDFPKDKLIVDFYDNKDHYLVSYINKSEYGVYQVFKSIELEKSISQIHSTLNSKAEGDFQKSAFYIYQKLLSPILDKNQSNRLIVIPDGKLSYLPFDILLKKINKNGTFKNFDYLINNYLISYQYSFSLIYNKKKSNSNSKSKVLALLPDFKTLQGKGINPADEATRNVLSNLTNLPFAQIELENLSNLFEGEYLIGSDAKESQFKAKAPFADIIHLATHSLINENNPMTSQLLLNGDETEDGLLHTYELFNLSLNADLVTLSACNSGYGELQQGEGVISLARGFMYANVPNVLMSLWAVSDQSTSKLMSLFYDKVYEGESYSEAIRNAKLDYLLQADENTAHPYYWAGFVYLGDVESDEPNYLYYFLFGIASLIALYFLYRRFRVG